MTDQLALLPHLLAAHVRLTLLALLVGVVISVPAGVGAAKVRWLEAPLLSVAGVVQTIPSLALLAVMVPLLAALGLPNIGVLPAFIGLVVYSVLPILQNTVAGIRGVEPALLEAARGIGMTGAQQLWRIELPLSLPVVIAGLRTATVWTVGIATLSTPVGAASLGNFIFTGLQTRNLDAILVGCIAAAALALVLDGLVRAFAAALDRRRPLLAVASVGGVLAVAGAACLEGPSAAADHRSIVIGSKAFTEQYILSEVLAGRIERATGLRAERKQSLGSTVVFDALRTGAVDVYVDYSGTIWATVLQRHDQGADRAAVIAEVSRELASRYDIALVASLGFENAYALAMRRADAGARNIRTISDLARHSESLRMGGDYEFFGRAEWRSLEEAYRLHFREMRTMDPALMYDAVATSAVDVISAFSTDGRIASYDLVLLEDDRHAIPPYDAIVLASGRAMREHPRAIESLSVLSGQIDGDAMRQMNLAVDRDGESPAAVAARLLSGLDVSEAL